VEPGGEQTGTGGAIDVARVLRELRDPNGPDVVRVGTLPPDRLAHWIHRVTDEVVITRIQYRHYLDKHPELSAFEEALVSTVAFPDAIYEQVDRAATAMFYRRDGYRHDMAVVLRVSETEGLMHSIISARRQFRNRRGKPASRFELRWSGKK